MPGQKQRVAPGRVVVLAELQRQPVDTGVVLVAAVIRDPHQRLITLAQPAKLTRRELPDVLAMADRRRRPLRQRGHDALRYRARKQSQCPIHTARPSRGT